MRSKCVTIAVLYILSGAFLRPAIAQEDCRKNVEPSEIRPTPQFYDEYLGESKDYVESLANILCWYNSHNGEDRFRAWLAIKRLEEMPVEQAISALPELLFLVGKPFEPYQFSYINPTGYAMMLQIYHNKDRYPVDNAVRKFGARATPLVLEAINGHYIMFSAGQTLQDVLRPKLPHLADILVAIEGRQKAEEVLFSKYDTAANDSERRRFKNAIAMVRAREGVERFAETPDEKYQQELTRLEEELAGRQRPPEGGQPKPASSEPIADSRDKRITAGTRSSSEWEQETPVAEATPFPWVIVIIAAAAALAVGAVAALLLKRAKKTAK